MFNVIWNGTTGITVPDNLLDQYVADSISDWVAAGKPDQSIEVGNADMFDTFRMAIVRNLIQKEELQMWYKEEALTMSDTLQYATWPAEIGEGRQRRMLELLSWLVANNS